MGSQIIPGRKMMIVYCGGGGFSPGNSHAKARPIKFLMFHKVLEVWNFAKAYKIKGLQVVLYILLLCYLINIYMRLFFTYYIVLLCSLLCIIFGVFGSLLQKTRNFGTIPKKPLQPYDFKAFYIVPGLRNFIRTLLNNTHYNDNTTQLKPYNNINYTKIQNTML